MLVGAIDESNMTRLTLAHCVPKYSAIVQHGVA